MLHRASVCDEKSPRIALENPMQTDHIGGVLKKRPRDSMSDHSQVQCGSREPPARRRSSSPSNPDAVRGKFSHGKPGTGFHATSVRFTGGALGPPTAAPAKSLYPFGASIRDTCNFVAEGRTSTTELLQTAR
ncbi:hypothetical protein EVAR_51757_1 [Eumeta japonica]|uniref:Uncharacterized protein n=1 Tax=Eumeta variegata TaxID=151549 RepID=A0A4C1XDE5_EUMVA|nr:hypothetical protein EVAR_51757_1 [Eumeta japonica]